jgi:hypothetical protein
MVQLRLGPSGPPIVGNASGDILIWNGTEWVPGPNPAGGLPSFTSQFENNQNMNLEVQELVEGAELSFSDVPEGYAVFIQCVLNTTSTGNGFCNPRLLHDDQGAPTVFWEPGPVLWEGGESPGFGKVPIQCQTPPTAGPNELLTVTIEANGTGQILSGNMFAELIPPR